MPLYLWHTRLCLAALGLMLSLPFLNPHHFNPIPTFYQEWTAAACALLASTLLLRAKVFEQLEIPSIALLPLGIAALILIQFAAGLVAFPTQALIFLLYLLWAVLLLMLGRALRQIMALDQLVTVCATAILTGALLSSVLLALQLVDPRLGLGWVFPFVKGSGNLGQANHLANYLWLGVASAFYLHSQGKISSTAFWPALLALVSASSLSGSRSVFLYAGGFSVLALWAAWHFRQPALRQMARRGLILLPLTLTLQAVFSYFDLGSLLQTSVSGDRFFQLVSGSSVRLQLWQTGLTVFAEHPWLGAGIGQFPVSAYQLAGDHADGRFLGGAEHAHNLFVQLLAEFGFSAPLLVIGLSVFWWIGFIRQAWTPAHWWIASVLLVIAVHSQLEYPLWYAFFLGIAALVLGLGSATGLRPRTSALGRLLIALCLLLGTLTLSTLGNDYRQLEHTLNAQLQTGEARPSWKKTLESLAQLHKDSLFSHYVALSYAYQLSVDKEALKGKITVCELAIRVSPVDLIVFKRAYLLALDGRMDDARSALRSAMVNYPEFVAGAGTQLAGLSTNYPELVPLLEVINAYQRQKDASGIRKK